MTNPESENSYAADTPAETADAHLRDYRVKVQQYGREFLQAIRLEFPPGELLRQKLKQSQQALGLSDRGVEAIETKLSQAFQAQRATYQANLQQYEQEFAVSAAQGLPFSPATQDRLWELQKTWKLRREDIAKIEGQILAQQSTNNQFPRPVQSPYLASLPLSSEQPFSQTAPTLLPTSNAPAFQLPPTLIPYSQIPYSQVPDSQTSRPFASNSLFTETESAPGFAPDSIFAPDSVPDPASIRLRSAKVDYSRLQALLQTRQWKQADRETLTVMLQAADRVKQTWLNAASLSSFPCDDLRIINQLWSNYSQNQFGFATQQQLYLTLQATTSTVRASRVPHELALMFCKKVEWWLPRFEFLKYYNLLDFTSNAPTGHLPAYWFWAAPWWKTIQQGGIGSGRGGCGIDAATLTAFMKRLQECGLNQTDLPANGSTAVPTSTTAGLEQS